MQLLLTKNTDKPHVIRFLRDDDTEAWTPASAFLVMHDLSHYALEKTLGYTGAFLGLVNAGMDPAAFEDRATRQKLTLNPEAWYAECMANLLLAELTQGPWEDFNRAASETFSGLQLPYPPPHLENESIDAVRLHYRELIRQWTALPDRHHMILQF